MSDKTTQPKHSRLSPSKACIWMQCPGMIALTKDLPPDESSKYAAEGTLAHALLEKCLKDGTQPDQHIGEEIADTDKVLTGEVTEDMALAVRYATDWVRTRAEQCAGKIITERKVDIVPGIGKEFEIQGTTDITIVSAIDDTLIVADYKHGAGVAVSATENEQMYLYAYGIIADKVLGSAVATCSNIEMTIIQPRINLPNKHSTTTITRDELLMFVERVKQKQKEIAEGSTELHDGTWCKKGFCRARKEDICPLLRKNTEDGLKMVGAAALVKIPNASALDCSALARVLDVKKAVVDFFEACEERALKLAEDGQNVPGYSLKEAWGNREWKDEDAVLAAFGDIATKKAVLSPAQLEKVKGVDKAKVAELTEKKLKGYKLEKTK